MRVNWRNSVAIAFSLPLICSAERILVVHDLPLDEYKQFFTTLEASHDVTYEQVKSDTLELVSNGELVYDNLIITPTKARSLGPKLSAKSLYEFMGLSGNILAVTSPSSVPESLRDFATEVDLNIAPRGWRYVDYFENQDDDEEDSEENDLLSTLSEESFLNDFVVSYDGPVSYSGGGAYLGNNELTFSLVSGSPTGFIYDAREDDSVVQDVWASGKQVTLAAAFQALDTNSRFGWLGDPSLLNSYVGEEIARWVFNEKSVISVEYVEHNSFLPGQIDHSKDGRTFGDNGPLLYSVNEELIYTIALSQKKDGKSVPFVPESSEDLPQLEFIMLDPYYRLTLEVVDKTETAAIYSTHFKIPDQYGVFTLKTEYARQGLSYFTKKDVVTVRHIANDEWPRSWDISNSWVYLTSHLTVVAAWCIFVVLYLYTKTNDKPKNVKANKESKVGKEAK